MYRLFLLLVLLLGGCKTKQLSLEKKKTKEVELLQNSFDSIFQTNLQHQLDLITNQQYHLNNLMLSSITEIDSNGQRKPFHYKHYVDGELIEEIYLEGGEINQQVTTSENKETSKKDEYNSASGEIHVDQDKHRELDASTIDKSKKVKTTGFQFGFYLWLFFIIIAILVLWYVNKKINLIDKIKTVIKGGKKPSDII